VGTPEEVAEESAIHWAILGLVLQLHSPKTTTLSSGIMYGSILGEPRATLDVDIVADFASHVQALVEVTEFFIDEISKSSFNVIHLDTMQKVDIFCYPISL